MGGPFWNGGVPTRDKRMGGADRGDRYDDRQGQGGDASSIIPNYSGVVATAGGLVFSGTIDGTFTAFDDEELKPLWSFNVGTAITAPPISYSVGGKQFIAVHVGGGNPWNIGLLKAAPELKTSRAGRRCSCSHWIEQVVRRGGPETGPPRYVSARRSPSAVVALVLGALGPAPRTGRREQTYGA